MGLEEFRPDDEELGDTYYEITLRGNAVVRHPGLYEDLPRELQGWLSPRTRFAEDRVKAVIPFELSARGNSIPLANEAAEDRLDLMRNTEFDNDRTSIEYVKVQEKNIDEKEVDW